MDVTEAYERLMPRVTGFGEDPSRTDLMTQEATDELETLCHHIQLCWLKASQAPLELLRAAGHAHWYRYLQQLVASRAALEELQDALQLFEPLYAIDTSDVPEETWGLLERRSRMKTLRASLTDRSNRAPDEEAQTVASLIDLLREEAARFAMDGTLAELALRYQHLASITDDGKALLGQGQTLVARFEMVGGNVEVLDQAVECLQEAVARVPTGAEREQARAALWHALGVRQSLPRGIGLPTLDRPPTADGTPAKGSMDGAKTRPVTPSDAVAPLGSGVDPAERGRQLRWAYEHHGDPALLDRAVTLLRQAAKAHPHDARTLTELGIAIRLLAPLADTDALLAEAEAKGRRAVEWSKTVPAREFALGALGTTLLARYQVQGDPAVLDEAIATLRAALGLLDETSVNWANQHTNLGLALLAKASLSDDGAVLDEAIGQLRAARSCTPPNDPYLPIVLGSLGQALLDRASRSGLDVDDLREALVLQREAVAHPGSQAIWPEQARRLADTLLHWFHVRGEVPALDEAVNLLRRVRAKHGPATLRHRTDLRLAQALLTRWSAVRDPSALTEAFEILQPAQALEAFQAMPSLEHFLIGSALWHRGELNNDRVDLEQAIAHLEAAVAAYQDRTIPSAYGISLGQMLNSRHAHLITSVGGPGKFAVNRMETPDARRAVELLSAVACDTSFSPYSRMLAANIWVITALNMGRPKEALPAYELLFELLETVGPGQLRRHDQEHQLRRMEGLAHDAAECAIAADDAPRAVSFLEAGRGVLIAEMLNRRAGPDLVRRHDPELADALARINRDFDSYAKSTHAIGDHPSEAASRWSADHHHRLAAEHRELIRRIRETTPLKRFHLPPDVDELTGLSCDGPIALINLGAGRSDAILLVNGGIEVLRLEDLVLAEVKNRVIAFHSAVTQPTDGSVEPEAQLEAESTVAATLDWLWWALVHPVLHHLGLGPREPNASTAWPRLWWSPTGALNFLPLHAAGTNRRGENALDRVVSSYAPTLKMLSESRQPSGAFISTTVEPKMLLVAQSRSRALKELPGADREAAALAQWFPDATTLANSKATRKSILDHLPQHRWVHIACHALTDISRPSDSHLIAHDGQVSIRDLARLHTNDGDLAFLAACETARGAPDLADEAVHLGAAFQLLGFRHVIGTLWTAADDVAAQVVNGVYGAIRANFPDPGGTPYALHTTVRALRRRYPRVPSLWSGYAHFGP